jgi:phosphoenolpyruvate-protein phosphotransferase (PTS system enzyme I)
MFQGIGASPGITMGKVYHLDRKRIEIPKFQISNDQIESEIERFKKAISQSKSQLEKIKKKLSKNLGENHIYIIDTHILILQDELLIGNTIKNIRNFKINAEWAFKRSLKHFSSVFENIDDEYLKERKNDIEQIGDRILNNLIGNKGSGFKALNNSVIIVAHYLSPAEAIQMKKSKILGIVTDVGSRTSHTAIMARALQIPAVVGLKDISKKVNTGDSVILDGGKGIVVINPEEMLRKNFSEKQKKYTYYLNRLEKLKEVPAKTKDNYTVDLLANMEYPEEIVSVVENGARGIGLFRTEYLFLNRKDFPSEEEQFDNYKSIAEKISPYPAAIRTIDIGGDKFYSSSDISDQMRVSKGLRAIRFCLQNEDIFRTQLRALLRASHFGELKIIFPLITSRDEIMEVNRILKSIKDELDRENIPYDRNIKTGVMIETPSAAIISDILAKETDFFSIGTNDLTQYVMAIDRNNEHLAYLDEPLHPAILRLIKMTVDNARKAGISVSICGEMGGEALNIIVLLGLGIDIFSMNPLSIPKIKKILQSITLKEAKKIAKNVLTCSTADEVKKLVLEKMDQIEFEEFEKESFEALVPEV